MHRRARARLSAVAAAMAGCALAGCSETATPRPQIVLVLDTDLPVVGQLRDDASLSPDAAIDSLRVEVQSSDGSTTARDLLTLSAPEADAWPVSFGIDASAFPSGRDLRVRARAFRSDRATPGTEDGDATLDPDPAVTVDRLVDLPPPDSGVDRWRVTLRGDCIGAPAAFPFKKPATTCVDGAQLAGAPTDGIAKDDGSSTLAGSWQPARAAPCGPPPSSDLAPGAVCIQGSFAVIGDTRFDGVEDAAQIDSVPLLPAKLESFYIDPTEFTVKRLRDLVAQHGYAGPLPLLKNAPGTVLSQFCAWLGDKDGSDDDLPVNCVDAAAASEICKAAGGTLPTEAQWEFAARGRGRDFLYPWGDEEPDCMRACAGRSASQGVMPECSGGFDAAGTHPGDASLDGVLDMGGSLQEVTSDLAAPFSAPCWRGGPGVVDEPRCTSAEDTKGFPIIAHTLRGGDCTAVLKDIAAPYRRESFGPNVVAGFRCVYPGAQ